jgi:hypothetical protein
MISFADSISLCKFPEGLEKENIAGDTPHVLARKVKLDGEISQFLNPYEEFDEDH